MTKKTTKKATPKKKAPAKKKVVEKEVLPEEIEHEVIPPTKIDDVKEEEPSWYHYVFVIVVFCAAFFVIYVGFEMYEDFTTPDIPPQNTTLPTTTYKYPYVVGNVTYNLFFYYPIDELNSFDYEIEPNKFDMLNTVNYTFVYDDYVGTDNGKIAATSTKFRRFLEIVYKFDFNENSFARANETSCVNSTQKNKVVTFNPYANESGIFLDKFTGCVEFKGESADDIVKLIDKFMYELTLD